MRINNGSITLDAHSLSMRTNEHRPFERVFPEIRGARLLLQVLAFLCVSLLPVAAYSQGPLFTFAQISDAQPRDATEQARFERVLDTIVAGGQPGALIPRPVNFVMFAGDLVDSASNQIEWTSFLNTINTRLTARGIPYRAVPGNHDWNSSVGFTNYETYIGSAAVWESRSSVVTGHNGLTVTTGWRGLDFIGLNNSNGGDNKVSSTDLARINLLAGQASVRSENIFLVAHHPHNETSSIPLTQTLNNPDVVGYMRGHTGSPHATSGLAGIQNPNVWDLSSAGIINRGGILYYEVYPSQILVYTIQLTQNPTALSSAKTITLVHPMLPAGLPVVPTVNFTASPLSGTAPLTVAFIDQSAGLPTSWAWDFGDGNTSSLQSPVHTFGEGTFDVSLTVANDQGNDALVKNALITVQPAPPMVTFLAVGDAHVKSTALTTNYGTLDHVRVRAGSTAYDGYFMFDVNGLGGATVLSATLRLFVVSGSKDGGTVYHAGNSWSEKGITWGNAPGGTAIGNLGSVSSGTWVEFDVSAQVQGDGRYSFALASDSTSSAYYSSREGVNPPELVVLKSGSDPDPDPDITVNPLSYNYGSVAVGQSRTTLINVANNGSATLMVSSTSLGGAGAPEFALTGGGSFSLAPGSSQNIQVSFNPSSAGAKSAVLNLVSDDPDEALVVVNLSGTGTSISTGNISLQEVKTGGSSGTASVSTGTDLSAVAGDVYIASISSKAFRTVSAVNGLGLAWTELRGQCSGRNQTGVSIWTATGTPSASSSVVTAVLSGSVSNAVIAVARYSGVGSMGGVASANTNGTGGSCSGGLDSSSYGMNLTTTGANSEIHAAVAMRNMSHTAGGGFVEQALVLQGASGGTIASVAVLDEVNGSAGVVGVTGSFSGSVDWAVAAVELKP